MYLKEIPLDDRPREKLILRGPQSLTDAELVAILLRTGTKGKSVLEIANDLIKKHNNLSGLALVTVAALKKDIGIGSDKAATLAAAFEIARRVAVQNRYTSKNKITSPNDVAEIFIPLLRDEVKEHFVVVCLNTANKIIKYEIISIGNLNSSVVHPREIFKVAIDNNSANIILLHNHPSGNLEPSREDISVTKRLVEAGKLLDIQVFDHIIIGNNNYYSFVEHKQI